LGTPVLVDSNVLLDSATEDPKWQAWSERMLTELADSAVLVINPVIFAEISAAFETIEETEVLFPPEDFRREEIPYEAAFLAGKCHLRYRRLGGARDRTLPDFLIGAHAAVRGYRLLTRDGARYRTYFPRLEVVGPE
jgi:predicted nucleic acid-binding protein